VSVARGAVANACISDFACGNGADIAVVAQPAMIVVENSSSKQDGRVMIQAPSTS
jgi:hypothetical protein